MGVRENLIAARALIDAPEKWKMRGESAVVIFRDLNHDDYTACRNALAESARLAHHGLLTMHLFGQRHPDILALFDRAIAACTTEQVA